FSVPRTATLPLRFSENVSPRIVMSRSGNCFSLGSGAPPRRNETVSQSPSSAGSEDLSGPSAAAAVTAARRPTTRVQGVRRLISLPVISEDRGSGRSVGVGRDDLAAGDGPQRPPGVAVDRALDEPDAAVGQQGVDPARVVAPRGDGAEGGHVPRVQEVEN